MIIIIIGAVEGWAGLKLRFLSNLPIRSDIHHFSPLKVKAIPVLQILDSYPYPYNFSFWLSNFYHLIDTNNRLFHNKFFKSFPSCSTDKRGEVLILVMNVLLTTSHWLLHTRTTGTDTEIRSWTIWSYVTNYQF